MYVAVILHTNCSLIQFLYLSPMLVACHAAREFGEGFALHGRGLYGQSPYSDSGFHKVSLKQNLNIKGWKSQGHREVPGKFESRKLTGDNHT